MSLKTFIWERMLSLAFNLTGMLAVSFFIGIVTGIAEAAIVAACWTTALIMYCSVSFYCLKKRIAKIRQTALETEDKFLLSEVVPRPFKNEDCLYYELMLMQGKAAIECVKKAEQEKAEYYDYLQDWVHEVKTPIAAIGLICTNHKGPEFAEIMNQTDRINNYAEQVLFEARTRNPEKDLLIQETDLTHIVNDCIKENKQLFIEAGIQIENSAKGIVLTDEKWLSFVLKQILYNSVQYRKESNAHIQISAITAQDGKLKLSVTDNGIGILESELPRIFQKGFTGSNGRRNKKSTGFGLYLCKKLCDAMDVSIYAESEKDVFTRMSLTFRVAPNTTNLTKL